MLSKINLIIVKYQMCVSFSIMEVFIIDVMGMFSESSSILLFSYSMILVFFVDNQLFEKQNSISIAPNYLC